VNKWRGELEGVPIKHGGDMPVTVKVPWTDGAEGEVSPGQPVSMLTPVRKR
jgi:hypothetical protein